MSHPLDGFIQAIAAALAEAVRPIIADEVRRGIAESQERRVTLQEYRGGSTRANAAFERRHADLAALAVVVGRRRYYLRADLDRHFGASR